MTTEVDLTPLTSGLVTALPAVTVAPEQVGFSGQPSDVLDAPEPNIDIHVILFGGRAVGMFRIDQNYHDRYSFATADTPGLRTYLIDREFQGRGIASASCRLLKAYLHDQYPRAKAAYLTVNLSNPIARRVYLAGGFIDTGDQWPWGNAGPQNILRLDLNS